MPSFIQLQTRKVFSSDISRNSLSCTPHSVLEFATAVRWSENISFQLSGTVQKFPQINLISMNYLNFQFRCAIVVFPKNIILHYTISFLVSPLLTNIWITASFRLKCVIKYSDIIRSIITIFKLNLQQQSGFLIKVGHMMRQLLKRWWFFPFCI